MGKLAVFAMLASQAACLSRPTAPVPITHSQSFAATTIGPLNVQANAIHDAIVVQFMCGTLNPVSITLTAPAGWNPYRIGVYKNSRWNVAVFGMIAPDTKLATFTTSTNSVACDDGGFHALGDEFANADATGGTTTFDQHLTIDGVDDACAQTMTTASPDEAVWAACIFGGILDGVPADWAVGANDGLGNLAEYKLTMDPAGMAETTGFHSMNGTADYVVSAVTIKPQ